MLKRMSNLYRSAVFQAGGLAVVLAEVDRKHFLASIVPVIVNSVLNNHNFIVDIVAFVSKGDFPRSRLGEKQRGKILASWVTRKMRTIAQFAIRDPNAEEDGPRHRGSGSLGPRGSTGSATMFSPVGGSSTRSRELHRDSLPAELQSMSLREPSGPAALPQNEFHAELPATYPEDQMIPELPADESNDQQSTPTASRRASDTTVGNSAGKQRIYELADDTNYSPVDALGPFSDRPLKPPPRQLRVLNRPASNPSLAQAAQDLPGSLLPPAAVAELRGPPMDYYDSSGEEESDDIEIEPPPLPSYANKPYLAMLTHETGREGRLPSSPTYNTGRRSRENSRPNSRAGDARGSSSNRAPVLATIPSQREVPSFGSYTSGLTEERQSRIANRDSTYVGLDEGTWPTEALMHMGIGMPPNTMPKRKDAGKGN
jgi:hypothetical protein